MRLQIICAAVLALSACAPAGQQATRQGVGFGSYEEYEAARLQRESELRGGPVRPAQVVVPPETQPAAGAGAISSSELAAAGIGASSGTGADRDALGDGRGASTVGVDVQIASSGISDEQDFEAVSDRETIESDAQRRQRQAAAYRVIQPTPVPERAAAGGPNIVEFALSTSHPKGQQIYSRSPFAGENRQARACAEFFAPDQAQQAFLAAGGPERDRLGVDPDGDGYACGWDPAPFRAVRN
ncbi:hypothetical protein AADZ90_007505 [Aestuariibius sp. 2305UL40-4]|uniref:hypothetical protein n=1 Tax=Aestuariibius violaceus TaxID=3234132 RepID=UPI00345EB662